jgi:hypothetical protein
MVENRRQRHAGFAQHNLPLAYGPRPAGCRPAGSGVPAVDHLAQLRDRGRIRAQVPKMPIDVRMGANGCVQLMRQRRKKLSFRWSASRTVLALGRRRSADRVADSKMRSARGVPAGDVAAPCHAEIRVRTARVNSSIGMSDQAGGHSRQRPSRHCPSKPLPTRHSGAEPQVSASRATALLMDAASNTRTASSAS